MAGTTQLGRRRIHLVDAAGLALTVVLAGLTGFVFVRASLAKVVEMQEEERRLTGEMGFMSQMATALSLGEETLDELEDSVAAVNRRLPSDMNFPDFYDAISDLADTYDVLLSQLKPGSIEENEGYREMSVSIRAIASFENFYLFLFDMGSLPRLTKLDSLAIRATRREQLCDIDMTVKIFAAKEKREAAI